MSLAGVYTYRHVCIICTCSKVCGRGGEEMCQREAVWLLGEGYLLAVVSELDHRSYKALLGSLRSMQNQALPFIDNR